MTKPSGIAMCLCVQNEERFLDTHLRYHFAAGVERVFLFLDQTTDRSREIAERYSCVAIIEIPPEEKAKHGYIFDLHRACMDRAKEWAREEGFTWLLTIDPDEYVIARPDLLSSDEVEKIIDLKTLVDSVAPETFQVRFPTWEVVPGLDLPWQEQIRFQTSEQVSYQLPGLQERWHGFLGHFQGKSMIRTNVRAQAFDSHRWVIDQSHWGTERPEYAEIPTEWFGCHLHYYITEPSHILEKFKKAAFEPEVWACGTPVEAAKQQYKEISGTWTLERAREYMKNELDPRIEKGELTEVTLMRDFSATSISPEPAGGESHLAEEKEFPHRKITPLPVSDWEPHGEDVRTQVHNLLPRDLRGFFFLEFHDGNVFRWTGPEFSIRLAEGIGKDRSRIHLDMKSLCDIGQDRTLYLISGTGEVRGIRERDGWTVEHSIEAGSELRFRVEGTLSFPGDSRELGIPVFAVELS